MIYHELSSVYDHLMEHAPYDDWYVFTKHIFQEHETDITSIADIGCGTGEITLRLAKDQYQMYGVDYSSHMLSVAQQKSMRKELDVFWIQQDVRRLQGLQHIDAVISYCDVINYITSIADLKKAFQQIAQILKPGGLFIFDVHSLAYVENHLINHTFADVYDDYAYVWFCYPGEAKGSMYHDLTFFMFDGKAYKRFEESHYQKTYPVETYKQLLQETGFKNIKIYSDFSQKIKKSLENTERIFFVTEKMT